MFIRPDSGRSDKESSSMRIQRKLRLADGSNGRRKTPAPAPGPAETAVKLFPWELRVGFQTYRVNKSWIIKGTREQLAILQAHWRDSEWAVVHHPTGVAVIPSAPSREYALKLLGFVLPRLDLARLQRGFWNDAVGSIPDDVVAYLNHVWRASYSLEEIPTVEQWQKSGLKNSHQKVNGSRGKIKVKRKR